MIRFLKETEWMQVVKGDNERISCVTDWLHVVTDGNNRISWGNRVVTSGNKSISCVAGRTHVVTAGNIDFLRKQNSKGNKIDASGNRW